MTDSWAAAFAQAAEVARPSVGRRLLMGFGAPLVAALIYGRWASCTAPGKMGSRWARLVSPRFAEFEYACSST